MPPSPSPLAQHGVLSDFNVGHGGKGIVARRGKRGERYYDFRRFIRLIRVRGIFFVWIGRFGGGEGRGGLRDLARGIRPALDLFSDVYCSWIRVFRRVLIGFRAGGSFNELGITFAKTFFFLLTSPSL